MVGVNKQTGNISRFFGFCIWLLQDCLCFDGANV